jgi:hypothetical protein
MPDDATGIADSHHIRRRVSSDRAAGTHHRTGPDGERPGQTMARPPKPNAVSYRYRDGLGSEVDLEPDTAADPAPSGGYLASRRGDSSRDEIKTGRRNRLAAHLRVTGCGRLDAGEVLVQPVFEGPRKAWSSLWLGSVCDPRLPTGRGYFGQPIAPAGVRGLRRDLVR